MSFPTFTKRMSAELQKRLEVTGLLITLALSALAFGKAWFTLPYRLDQAEAALASAAKDRELLVRIDERLSQVQKDVAEVKRTTQPR